MNPNPHKLLYTIQSLSVRNYQSISNLHIDNIANKLTTNEIADPQWIFLTGENGYGKTSLLQTIVIGLFGNHDGNTILNSAADIQLSFKNGEHIQTNTASQQNDDVVQFHNFAAYGPARLHKSPRPYNDSKTNSLFNSVGELLDIEERMIAWEKDSTQKHYYESAKNIFLDLLQPQVQEIVIERYGTKTSVKYIESADNKKTKKTFAELASGYRSIIAMIGDIIIRLSENQADINNFNQLAGIVIIDEFDLHLHPKWQKSMVEKLTNTFPNVQFIVSTHSPIPLLGAPPNTVIINVDRTEEGITAQILDVDFSTLTPNAILSSPIFGFKDFLPKSIGDLSKLKTGDSYDEEMFKEEVKRRVNEIVFETEE